MIRQISRVPLSAVFAALATLGLTPMQTKGGEADLPINQFIRTGDLNQQRTEARYEVLHDRRVLAIGGETSFFGATETCELYDPTTGRWSPTGSLPFRMRFLFSAVLRSGHVVAFGSRLRGPVRNYSYAAIYDPASGTWTRTTNRLPSYLNNPHSFMDSVVLRDGRVLAFGGGSDHQPATGDVQAYDDGFQISNRVVVFDPGSDPVNGTWSYALNPMTGQPLTLSTPGSATGRATANVVRLANGKVMIIGGIDSAAFASTAAVDVYDPTTRLITPLANMPAMSTDDGLFGFVESAPAVLNKGSRWQAGAVELDDGHVLVAGGALFNAGGFTVRRSAILYNFHSNTWREVRPMARRRVPKAISVEEEGAEVLVVGSGYFANPSFADQTSEIFVHGQFQPGSSFSTNPRLDVWGGRLLRLSDDEIILISGTDASVPQGSKSTYLYLPKPDDSGEQHQLQVDDHATLEGIDPPAFVD